MKTIAVVAAAGHGKTWTLGAIQDKALAEGKQLFTIDPSVYRTALVNQRGAEYAINRALINIERSLAVNAGGHDKRPTALILDEVAETQLTDLQKLIEHRLPTLDYLVMAVSE